MLLDIEINALVGSQMDLAFEKYVEHLWVLGFSIRSRGNLTSSVDMLLMIHRGGGRNRESSERNPGQQGTPVCTHIY
jgi:hypothetical protein